MVLQGQFRLMQSPDATVRCDSQPAAELLPRVIRTQASHEPSPTRLAARRHCSLLIAYLTDHSLSRWILDENPQVPKVRLPAGVREEEHVGDGPRQDYRALVSHQLKSSVYIAGSYDYFVA